MTSIGAVQAAMIDRGTHLSGAGPVTGLRTVGCWPSRLGAARTVTAGRATPGDVVPSPDEARLRELMTRGMAGDGEAYRMLLFDLASLLRRFFGRRMSGLPFEVEDLVQETLLAVHTRRRAYDPRRPFTAWAYAIARHKFVDCMRRRGRREALHEELQDDAFSVEPAAEASDCRRDLMALLAQLPPRQRVPILLVKVEGLPVAEAAERTGMSMSAVKVGVHRGLKKLAAVVAAS